MLSEFSSDGRYYAQLTGDSKLKIWETATNKFLQEFIPDFQLTSPCTCLQFLGDVAKKHSSPKKKKKRLSLPADGTPDRIALGTASGSLLLYSIAKADLELRINSETNQSVGCLSWNGSTTVFCGIDQNVVAFHMIEKTVTGKWKAGNEKITSILSVPNSANLLTASRDIKLWNTGTKQQLKSFTGHSHEVVLLRYIAPPNLDADPYFMSGSKVDRLLSVWNLNLVNKEKGAITNFLLEDVPRTASVYTQDGVSNLVAVTRSGAAQIFQHTLNGKCTKPLKPELTIHIAAEAAEKVTTVTRIPIVGANFAVKNDLCVIFCHGNDIKLSFELEDLKALKENEKVKCLIRQDPNLVSKTPNQKVTNVHIPVTNKIVNFITPYSNPAPPVSTKRKGESNDCPMEKRLENLSLNVDEAAPKVLKINNLAHLLLQGLQSKDQTILKRVLTWHEDKVIISTLRRLPITVLKTLAEHIIEMIQGKTLVREKGILWLKHFIKIHAGVLIANHELLPLLSSVRGFVFHNGIAMQQGFVKLSARLNLQMPEIKKEEVVENDTTNEFLLEYTDRDTQDSDDELEDEEVEDEVMMDLDDDNNLELASDADSDDVDSGSFVE